MGNIFSYTYNYYWVFSISTKILFIKRLPYYFIAAFISLILNMILLFLLVECLAIPEFQGQLLLIPLIVVFNFSVYKYWVYGVNPKP